jgi:hypothetical protein
MIEWLFTLLIILNRRKGCQKVLGYQADHPYIWLIPRYPNTPREYWGLQLDERPKVVIIVTLHVCRSALLDQALW